MLEQRTLMTTRLVWVQLATYLRTQDFATVARLRDEYDVTKEFSGMEMPESTLKRMILFSEHVAKEYVAAYTTPAQLEIATRSMAAAIGIGMPSEKEQETGDLIYADMMKAVQRNKIHIDFRS